MVLRHSAASSRDSSSPISFTLAGCSRSLCTSNIDVDGWCKWMRENVIIFNYYLCWVVVRLLGQSHTTTSTIVQQQRAFLPLQARDERLMSVVCSPTSWKGLFNLRTHRSRANEWEKFKSWKQFSPSTKPDSLAFSLTLLGQVLNFLNFSHDQQINFELISFF